MKKLIALCALLASAAYADDTEYGQDLEITRLKPTDPATLVSLVGAHEMTASHIKVGHLTDGHPLLCFKDPDKQLVGCFVLNIKTLQVVFIQLPADETSV